MRAYTHKTRVKIYRLSTSDRRRCVLQVRRKCFVFYTKQHAYNSHERIPSIEIPYTPSMLAPLSSHGLIQKPSPPISNHIFRTTHTTQANQTITRTTLFPTSSDDTPYLRVRKRLLNINKTSTLYAWSLEEECVPSVR